MRGERVLSSQNPLLMPEWILARWPSISCVCPPWRIASIACRGATGLPALRTCVEREPVTLLGPFNTSPRCKNYSRSPKTGQVGQLPNAIRIGYFLGSRDFGEIPHTSRPARPCRCCHVCVFRAAQRAFGLCVERAELQLPKITTRPKPWCLAVSYWSVATSPRGSNRGLSTDAKGDFDDEGTSGYVAVVELPGVL